MTSITDWRSNGMVNVIATGLLCVLQIAVLCFLFGINPKIIGLFVYFFLTHFFLTGVVFCLIATKLTKGGWPVVDIVIIGIVTDCALLILAWRLNFIEAYVFYPIGSFAVFLISSRRISVYERIPVHSESIVTQVLLVMQVIPPLLWLFSQGLDRHLSDQIFGVQAVSHWPPPNLVVADIPYSNNYVLHLLLAGVRTVTQIDLVLLVTRLSPIFLSWLFARSLFHFCFSYLRMPQIIALLPGFCFFIVLGYSPVVGHIFGTPTVTAAIYVQSPLFSFSIILLVLTIQSLLPQGVRQKCLILFSVFVAAFVGTGARAQLGPIVISGQSLLLLQALAVRKANGILWRMGVLAVMVTAVVAAIVFFLTVTSGFTGVSFLRFEANPLHFILENMNWYYGGKWLSELGVGPAWAAMAAFIIIIFMQASFLLPGVVWFIGTCWKRGFVALYPIEVLLLGTIIAGIAAVILTEAPGGSQYVFLHFSKIAAIILGAAGISDYVKRTGKKTVGRAIYIIGATALLATVQLIDTYISFYQLGRTGVTRALQPRHLADAERISVLEQFLNNQPDRRRSVFVYYGGLFQLGPYVLPVLGLQTIGDEMILNEYVMWESHGKSTLQRRLCLIKAFNHAVKSHSVSGNLIYALGTTLLGSYESIYVIVPTGTTVELPKGFEIRTGPDFNAYRVPMATVVEQKEQHSISDAEGCSGDGAERWLH